MSRNLPAAIGRLFAAFALTMALGIMVSAAQGTVATPGATAGGFPAHIHAGSCDELGDVVFPLSDLARAGADVPPDATPVDAIATPDDTLLEGTPASVTMEGMVPVAFSATTVEASLDDILAAEHAINVHESMENIQNYIACGDLTGEAADGELRIELKELNESGLSGEAVLADNGDGTTTVTVTLMQGAGGTPEATPAM